jgi:hypothetical protein
MQCPATNQPVGQISKIPSSSDAKNILVFLKANHRHIRAIPPHQRGVCAIVRKCEAGSGGRDASGAVFARTNDAARTAKSCGPDARIAGVKSLRG